MAANFLVNYMSETLSAGRSSHLEQGGRTLALDPGRKRVGLAVSDELGITARPLPPLRRTNWKKLLRDVYQIVRDFDAKRLVIGLPLNLDGTEGEAALEARDFHRKFSLSLEIPVYLQDERLTSREAEERLIDEGHSLDELADLVDSESAVIILRDFLASEEEMR